MKLTSGIYQLIMYIYGALPLKREICFLIRRTGLPANKFYRDLKFKGKFAVPVGDKSFYFCSDFSTQANDIFWNGLDNSFDGDIIWVWEILCKDAKVIIDAGANSGIFSLIAKTINPSSSVYAFEPVKRTYQLLQKNLLANKFDVKAENIALSDKDGQQIIYDVDFSVNHYQYSASLNPVKLKNDKTSKEEIIEYSVQTVKLDSYIYQQKIENIDLIKIDVELHEAELMEGFKEYLFRFNPNIVIEVLSEDVANRLNDILKGSNYLIYYLREKNEMLQCDKIALMDSEKCNFLLCRSDTSQKLQQYIKI